MTDQPERTEEEDEWLRWLRAGRSGEQPHKTTPEDRMAMLGMDGTPIYLPDGTLVGMTTRIELIEGENE